MAKNKVFNKKELYENMVKTEKAAYVAQDNLLDEIKKWFSILLDEETANHTKIILAPGGYIQVRTIAKLNSNDIEDFADAFNFTQTWFKDETMTDYRNIETVSVRVYEYGFIPKNINQIMGGDQAVLKAGLEK